MDLQQGKDGDRNLKLLSSDWNFIRSKTSSEMNHLLTFFVCWFSHTSNQDCIRDSEIKHKIPNFIMAVFVLNMDV